MDGVYTSDMHRLMQSSSYVLQQPPQLLLPPQQQPQQQQQQTKTYIVPLHAKTQAPHVATSHSRRVTFVTRSGSGVATPLSNHSSNNNMSHNNNSHSNNGQRNSTISRNVYGSMYDIDGNSSDNDNDDNERVEQNERSALDDATQPPEEQQQQRALLSQQQQQLQQQQLYIQQQQQQLLMLQKQQQQRSSLPFTPAVRPHRSFCVIEQNAVCNPYAACLRVPDSVRSQRNSLSSSDTAAAAAKSTTRWQSTYRMLREQQRLQRRPLFTYYTPLHTKLGAHPLHATYVVVEPELTTFVPLSSVATTPTRNVTPLQHTSSNGSSAAAAAAGAAAAPTRTTTTTTPVSAQRASHSVLPPPATTTPPAQQQQQQQHASRQTTPAAEKPNGNAAAASTPLQQLALTRQKKPLPSAAEVRESVPVVPSPELSDSQLV